MPRLTRELHPTHLGVSIDSIGTFSQLYWEFSVRRTFVCRPTNERLTSGELSFDGRQTKQGNRGYLQCKDTKYESEMQENCEVFLLRPYYTTQDCKCYSGLYPKLSNDFCDERQSLSTLTKTSRKMRLSKNFSKALRASVDTFFKATP